MDQLFAVPETIQSNMHVITSTGFEDHDVMDYKIYTIFIAESKLA